MGVSYPWIAYPLFRLTICMAAGIFLFDKYLSKGDSWLFSGMAFLGFCLLSWWVFYSRKWKRRWCFGCVAGLAFFLWGGARVLYQRTQVAYEWEKTPAVYQGVIQTVPESRGKTWRAEVYVTDKYAGTGKLEPVGRTILLSWLPDSATRPLSCGESVCFYARVSRPFSAENLTGFDYAEYLMRKGISGTALAYAGNWRRLDRKVSLTLNQRARICQQKVVDIYRSWGLDDEVLAVVSALTIGDKRELTSELKAVYNAAGASHVLALSGLHVGILSGLLWILFYPLTYFRNGRKVLSVCVIAVLWGFAFVAGLSASVVRAVVMCSLYVLASFCSEERFSGVHSLVLAAFLMLVYNPFYLFDISFQLSFAAVFSILAFYPLCVKLLTVKPRVLRYLWGLLCLSFSAQLGTLPLVLVHFGAFPTYFLLANLVVSPLAVCILALTLAALIFSAVPLVGNTLVMLLNFVTGILNRSMWEVQHWSGSQITSVYLSAGQAWLLALVWICLYVCWASGIHRKARDWIRLLVVCNLFFLFSWGEALRPVPEYLCFYRSGVYTCKGSQVASHTSDRGLMCIRNIRVGVMDSDCWSTCEASKRLSLDYAYICRGFKGNLSRLNELFAIRQVVLDTSLSEGYRKMLIKECQLLKISYTDLSSCGSYSIVL